MTPDVATTWLDLVNTGGVIAVLLAIIVYAAWLMPRFLKRWEEHTTALHSIKNELENIKDRLERLEK